MKETLVIIIILCQNIEITEDAPEYIKNRGALEIPSTAPL